MQRPICNICKSENVEHYLDKDVWELLRCRNCNLVFVGNIPSDENLRVMYDRYFFSDGQKAPSEGLELESNPTYRNALKRVHALEKTGFKEGKLLDVGCGTGIFLKGASSFDSMGLDVSEYGVAFAVDNLGVRAKQGSVFDCGSENGPFDVVTMWDVIEHVSDPDSYMEKVSEIVRPGGLLALSTGNIDSMMFRFQKTNWHLLIPPLHLFYFNPKNISILLRNHGFEVINIGHMGQYTNVGYMINKLMRTHSKGSLAGWLKVLSKVPFLSKINIYINLFDVMTIFAKRITDNKFVSK
jgi:SAM-dependent methyltransferase